MDAAWDAALLGRVVTGSGVVVAVVDIPLEVEVLDIVDVAEVCLFMKHWAFRHV